MKLPWMRFKGLTIWTNKLEMSVHVVQHQMCGSLEQALMCSGVMALSPAVSPRVMAKRLAQMGALAVHQFFHTQQLGNAMQQSLKKKTLQDGRKLSIFFPDEIVSHE